VLVTWVASAVIALTLLTVSDPERNASQIWRGASKAVWFAPAIILLSTLSPFGLAIGLILVVMTSRILMAQLIPLRAQPEERRWNPFPSVTAALALQFGWVAVMWEYPFLAAVLFALSCALIVAIALLRGDRKRERDQPLPPSPLGALLTILLALGISIGGLEFRDFAHAGDGGGGGEKPLTSTDLTEPEPEAAAGGSGFFGVILRVPKKTRDTVFAPPPRSRLKAGESSKEPFVIPFSGEYWMYQPPLSRPPRRSLVRKGSPIELSFHTNNGTGMSMEANQTLASAIDAACCRALAIEIARADGSASLYLDAVIEDSAAHRIAYLGQCLVNSAPTQTLRYSFDSVPLKAFDRIRVLYHRHNNFLLYSSPKIAIERFILEPR
jgi:hypothetical protein